MTWTRLRQEFEALVDLPAERQQQRLAALAGEDAGLADRLRELLASDARADGYLDRRPSPAAGATELGRTGLVLGRYELVRPLGSGGMGAVWEARQSAPERRVALKLVARDNPTDAERWRFQHEAQALAVLNHPTIATFYEAGEAQVGDRAVAWLAMELVEAARDVLTWADQRDLGRTARLALFQQLCDAVEHGHGRGVLHRDIKPGNVLVDGEGRLKLIDFGVARALAGEPGGERTATGEIVGTIQFMAPEQLAGRADAVGTWSDVYSLGVVLYHLLCGRSPYDADSSSLLRIATTVLERDPLPAQKARPDLPRDLASILAGALEKDPARRYATVGALREDLERFRRDLPVRARPAGLGYRCWKFVRRHRLGVTAAAAIAIVSAIAVTMTALALRDTRRAELAEREGRTSAEASLDFLVDVLSSPDPGKDGRDARTVDALTRAASQFEQRFADQVAVRAVLGRAIGRTFFGLGLLPEAERHLRAGVADITTADGIDDLNSLQAVLELVEVQIKLGKLDDAEAGLRRVDAGLAKLPPDEPLGDSRDVQRANLQRARGDRPGAEATLRAAIERMQRTRPDDYLILKATHLLAGIVHELGKLDEAERLYVRAHDGFVARFGEDGPESIAALQNLAMALASRGNFAAAVPKVEEVLASRQRVLGPKHVDTGTTLVNLGGLHIRLGQKDAAAKRLDEALAVLAPIGDDRLPAYQVALSNLMVLERDRHNYARSIELGDSLLALRQRTLGASAGPTLLTMVTLADVHRQSGDPVTALRQLAACEALAKAATPPLPGIVYQCELSQGWSHALRSEFAAAEQCFLRCIEMFESAEQASSQKGMLARAEPDLVAIYELTGRPELAAKYAGEHASARRPDWLDAVRK